MANRIMAAQPLSRNDLPILVQLFESAFDYYLDGYSPFFPDYLRALRTLVGLAYTATLADKSLLCSYQLYLARFLAENEGDFRANPHAKRSIAQSVSEMVSTSTIAFNALKYPRYYDDFIEVLRCTIAKIPESPSEKKEVSRILSYLTVKE